MIRRALPTESHQIQKYGLAALVRNPAMYGLATACAGAAESVAVLLPAIVMIPKMMRAIPPTTAISGRIGAGNAGKAEDDQEEDGSLDDDMPERDLEACRPVPGKGGIDGGNQGRARGKRPGKPDQETQAPALRGSRIPTLQLPYVYTRYLPGGYMNPAPMSGSCRASVTE